MHCSDTFDFRVMKLIKSTRYDELCSLAAWKMSVASWILQYVWLLQRFSSKFFVVRVQTLADKRHDWEKQKRFLFGITRLYLILTIK